MAEKPLEVVIIGGSLAGLMHGTMAKRLGHNVRILEQNTAGMRADYAAGIGTGPQGKMLLQEDDRTQQPYAFSCPGFQYLDPKSGVSKLLDIPLNLTSWDVIYYRLRANFDGLKSSFYNAPPASDSTDGHARVEHGKRAVNVTLSDEKTAFVEVEDMQSHLVEQISADLVIDASGPYSTVRNKLMPGLTHPYAGYVAWRGTAPESKVSDHTRELFDARFNGFVSSRKSYIVGYAVPGVDGDLTKGNRTLNWIWYYPLPDTSPFFKRAMTDVDGKFHRNTLPGGKLDPAVWQDLLSEASICITPAFLDVMRNTERPFITTIRDCASPHAVMLDGKYIVVGDALNLFRPHTGQAVNQAALQCRLLRRVLQGELSLAEWERNVLSQARSATLLSKAVGTWYMRGSLGWLTFLAHVSRLAIYTLWLKLVNIRRPLAKF